MAITLQLTAKKRKKQLVLNVCKHFEDVTSDGRLFQVPSYCCSNRECSVVDQCAPYIMSVTPLISSGIDKKNQRALDPKWLSTIVCRCPKCSKSHQNHLYFQTFSRGDRPVLGSRLYGRGQEKKGEGTGRGREWRPPIHISG